MSRGVPRTEALESGSSRRLLRGEILSQRYQIEAPVGRGAMGVVWRALDLELRRPVAIKVLPDVTHFPDARERLLREARAAAGLNHSHIVAVHDIGEDQGMPFFVMELVEGRSLGEERPSDLAGVVEMACQICEALEHAHAHGIVHRDLKPDNILVTGERTKVVKLMDLGLAVPTRGSRLTQAGTVMGTVSYMAPEQAMGETVDGRADLYALGVMLYEMVTGRLPFTGDRPLAIISQHVNAPPVPPRNYRPDLPRALEAVVLRLLHKQPAQRFATAAETAAALRLSIAARIEESGDSVAAVALLDALSRGRLVGRVSELAEARELWRRSRDGRGHCLLVSGEPGAGKTRFARELIIQAALDGAAVCSGACYEYEATTPYLPFAEAFRRLVRDHKDTDSLRAILADGAPLLAKLAPEIEARLGPFPERPELPPHEARLLFVDAVASAFRALAGPRGLLFYVDDLHWADSSTLWLFGHLLRNLREERVLLLASYRETELDRAHPLSKALVDWNRERLTTRFALRRFSPADTHAQLEALLAEPVSPEFSGAVHKETEGNPFFVEEVLKALIEQGSVRREGGRWQRAGIGDLHIPQSVKAAIGRRLDRVSPECNDVLRAAAVLGKEFDFAELTAAAGDRGEDALLDALDQAVVAQLLLAGRDDSFAFTHDKIREVLYEELNPIRRRRLHLKAAEGLERHRQRAPVPVETLAHHFIEAGSHERGLQYAKEAGAEAERLFAYDEAIVAYGRARECAETLGMAEEQSLLEETMGKACVISGNSIAALEHFERALEHATEPMARARLQSEAASSLVAVGNVRGLDYLRQARAVIDPERDPVDAANALCIEARFHHLAGRHRQAIELLEGAVALAAPATADGRATGLAASTMTLTLAFLSGAHQQIGLFADADRWAHRAIDFGASHGVPLAEALGYEFLGENAIGTGHWKEGLDYAERERAIASRIHSRERRAWSQFVTAMCHWCLRAPDRAEAEAREGIALAEAIGERRLESLLRSNLGVLRAEQGDAEGALALGHEALALADAMGLALMKTAARQCLAFIRHRRGELEEARQLCEEVLAVTAGKEPVISRLWIGPPHIESLVGLGRREEARDRHRVYAELVGGCQSPYFQREAERLAVLVG